MADLKPGDVLIPYSAAEGGRDASIVLGAPHTSSPTDDAEVHSERVEGDVAGVDATQDRRLSARSARIARRAIVREGFRRGL